MNGTTKRGHPILDTTIEELGLSTRTSNCLTDARIYNLSALAYLTRGELKRIRNFGPKSIGEVEACLDKYGLHSCMSLAEQSMVMKLRPDALKEQDAIADEKLLITNVSIDDLADRILDRFMSGFKENFLSIVSDEKTIRTVTAIMEQMRLEEEEEEEEEEADEC